MQEESDSEEEIFVFAEFDDSVNINSYRAIHVLGEDQKNPIIQLDESFYIGKYDHALGSYMFFEEGTVQGKDPLFDKYPNKCLKYVCQSRKLLNMEHAYVTPKEEKETNSSSQSQQSDDVQPVMFSSLQQATEAFKEYFNHHMNISKENESAMDVDGDNSGKGS